MYLRPSEDPFLYWFQRGDVSGEILELLERMYESLGSPWRTTRNSGD